MCTGTHLGKIIALLGQRKITAAPGRFLENLMSAKHMTVIQNWWSKCQCSKISKSDAIVRQVHELQWAVQQTRQMCQVRLGSAGAMLWGSCLSCLVEFQELSAVGLKFLCSTRAVTTHQSPNLVAGHFYK